MDNNKGIEMTTKLSTNTDKVTSSQDNTEDRPPTPPKRDFKSEDGPEVTETDGKRKKPGLRPFSFKFETFQKPEVIYRPESTRSCMSCLKNLLILFNLIIWLFGAALTGLGIWIKVDEEFWDIQTGLDMKQFTMAGYILIAAGVIIMIIGFVGCYGAFAQSLCTLIIYAIVVILIILLEIAVIALVWTASNNKDLKAEIKGKAKKAMQDMARDDYQQHFLNIMQSKLQCCGIDGPDDYKTDGIPHSCTDPDTGYPYEKGCVESVVSYLRSKAAILGGVAIAVFLLQLASLVLTICLACGIKQAASNAIF